MKIRNFFLLVMAVATITFASCVNNQSTNNNSDSTMNTRKILVTVDLQKDFINGTLPAKDAEQIIPAINAIKGSFDKLYFTLDWHPANHCSFTKEGGIWPVHCVHYTEGASIPDCILADVEDSKLLFYTKGMIPGKEEYGAFTDISINDQSMFKPGDDVVVCGIASEYCVLETLKELVRLSKGIGFNLSVFMDGVACIESHDVLLEYMKAEGIKEYK